MVDGEEFFLGEMDRKFSVESDGVELLTKDGEDVSINPSQNTCLLKFQIRQPHKIEVSASLPTYILLPILISHKKHPLSGILALPQLTSNQKRDVSHTYYTRTGK